MVQLFSGFRWTDVIDVAVVSAVLWVLLTWLRQARTRLALLGLAILGAVYVLARQLDLQLTLWLFSGFFAVFVVVIVVVFQEDLRHIFERIALWGLRRRTALPSQDSVDVVTRTVSRLAETHTGALIVLPGRDPIERHVQGGVRLGGQVSEPLLLSLFDASSPGHDGAVFLVGDRVDRFAAHLPLSSNPRPDSAGTRHSAGLGLSERVDALCIIVSEERGSVSVASRGHLRRLDQPSAVVNEIRSFLAASGSHAPTSDGPWLRAARRWREAAAGTLLAAILWILLIMGARVGEATREAAVVLENLPAGYEVVMVEPARVKVTAVGARRRLFLAGRGAFRVPLDGGGAREGERTYSVSPGQVQGPNGLTVRQVRPETVRVTFRHAAVAEPQSGSRQ